MGAGPTWVTSTLPLPVEFVYTQEAAANRAIGVVASFDSEEGASALARRRRSSSHAHMRRSTSVSITEWPQSLLTHGLSDAQQAVILSDCDRWFTAVEPACTSLFPTPARYYMLECIQQAAATGDSTSGLGSVFAFATMCQEDLGLDDWPAQSLS